MDRNRNVPMIRSTNRHDVRLFLFEELAIIRVLVRYATKLFVEFSSMQAVDIADGDHFAKPVCIPRDSTAAIVSPSATANSNAGNGFLVVWANGLGR